MKVTGTATLNAPAEQVWAALNDPAVLVRTIPGCEQLEAVGPDSYRMTVTAGVASIKGTYLGDVQLTDPAPPGAFTLKASGAGAPGTVSADVRVTLDDRGDGTTLLRYDADAVVGGPVGGVGQRVLSGVAKRTAGEFFTAVDAVLAERASGEPAGAAPATAPTGIPLAAVAAVAGTTGAAGAGADDVVPAPAGANGPAPTVFRRPAAGGATDGGVHVDVRNQLGGAVVGAVIALLGVWIGYRIASRNGRR